jgi:xylulokinase
MKPVGDELIIACDLGTGGNKASLYSAAGECLASAFVPYETSYPRLGYHEQRPEDWWQAMAASIRQLLTPRPAEASAVDCIAISGQSLGAVPLDGGGRLLRESTPIWSDTRAEGQVRQFFRSVGERDWYLRTGNGFPPACYTVFKIMWYRDHEPELFAKTAKVLGSKDYLNYLLTGNLATDPSYASGSGVYELAAWGYSDELIGASGLAAGLFPEIVPSTQIVGSLRPEAAAELGLPPSVKVVAGGVDNSCMALGARNIAEGRVYTSLGSSAWIAVSSRRPVLEADRRPFVFAHVLPEMFTSAVSIFAAGSTLKWVRDTLCLNLVEEARRQGRDPYELMGEAAARSPVGSRRLLFNPSLAGGSSQEASPRIRGAFVGLDLAHRQEDLIRACLEGIALNLGAVLRLLERYAQLEREMLMVGGGSRSRLWLQIFADVYEMEILKTNIDQEAGSLGAAALAAVGRGFWKDFTTIDQLHGVQARVQPLPENVRLYRSLAPAFEAVRSHQAKLGELLHGLDLQ